MKLKHIKLVKVYIAAGALAVLLLALNLFKMSSYVSEYIFTRGISRAYILIAGSITGIFPFSVFEILCGAAIVGVIIAVVNWIRFLRRKKYTLFLRSVSRVIIVALAVGCLYTATASFSYKRASLQDELPKYNGSVEKEQLIAMVDFYIADFNALSTGFGRDAEGNIIPPYGFNELSEKIRQEYSKLDNNDYFNKFTPKAKKMAASYIVSLFGILGISFQPTGEANINTNTAVIDLPQLMAHEFAHSKGVMREGDAELLSAYITLTSDDPYIRYSGYAQCIGQLLNMLSLNQMHDERKAAYNSIDSAIIKELNNAYKKYNSYSTFIEDIGTFINDIYLKMSGDKNGVDSYYDPGKIVEVPNSDGTVSYVVSYSPIQVLLRALYFNL